MCEFERKIDESIAGRSPTHCARNCISGKRNSEGDWSTEACAVH